MFLLLHAHIFLNFFSQKIVTSKSIASYDLNS